MTDVRKQLSEEIQRVKDEIDEQKKLIKKNAGKRLMVETAEAEMKALHTRLSVLEANLAKQCGDADA
jgi:predicted nuclease with TOPRIM domain